MTDEEFLKYEGKLVLAKYEFSRILCKDDLGLIIEIAADLPNGLSKIKLKSLDNGYIYECHENYILYFAYIINYNQNIVDMFFKKETRPSLMKVTNFCLRILKVSSGEELN